MSALSKMNSYLKGAGRFFERLGSKELQKQRKIVYLVFELLSLIGLFILLYSPICTANAMTETGVKRFRITPAFLFKNIKLNIASLLAFAPVQLIMLLLVVLFMILVVHRIIRSLITISVEDDLAQHARAAVLISGVGIFVYSSLDNLTLNIAFCKFSNSCV